MPLDDKTFDAILSGKPATAPAPDMAGGAITDIIRGAAAKYDIDPDIMVSLANRESGLRPDAKNPQSSAGGLFQFIDGTWKQYGRGDKFDPVANADAAARMLRENLDRFGGNYDAALAAHHVGPGKALQALRDGSIGDVNVSTQKWLADIKGQRQLNDELKAQKRNAFLAEDNPEYRPDFGGDVRPSAGSRSGFQAIGDTGASVLKGIGNFGESMGGLYGLATGDVDPNVVQTGGKALADFAESLKSDFIKNKERLSQQDIDAAEGHFNKFATAAWSNMSDPALLVNFFAEQAINFVPGMAAGRMAKGIIAGLGGASAAAIEAAPLAQKAMLMKRLETAGQIGTGVSVATGAVLQGADAGNSAYQQVMGRPQTEWDANPDYQRLVTTHGMDGAKQQIALQEARAAFAKSAVLSAGLNSFAPAHSIDKILVNGLKNKALTTAGREVVEKAAGQTLTRAAGTGAVKGFLGESASEALDEGYSQYAANEAEAAVNPNKDLLDDVAQNAGLGAAFGPMGAVTGGIEGHTRRKSAQELLQIATQQAAAQPNSPLSRAAAAAGPAVQASEQVAAEQAAAADPLAEQVAAIGDRLNDRAIYDAIRSHENLGPQALSDILGAYRVASNFNLDIKQRQAAVERLNNFFQLFDNQPNFTMGANGEAEQGGPLVPAGRGGESRRQESDVPTYDVGAPALGYQRQGDALTDERAKQAAAAEYEQAYQDLVKAEQLGAGDQELMQRQMALRQAEARLQEIQRTIDGNRQLDSAAKRDALLGDVLAALPPGQNPNRAFDRALRNAGFNETQFSEAERAKIAQWQQLSDGFMQQDAEPSRPNEMDAAALGIKEKQAAQAPANPNLAKVDAMLNAGMQRKGDKMFDPRTGKSVKLSPAQIARAKHLERQNDRNRVMPAYQRAIEQRTSELEQLLSDPNHDEAAAVRLARGLSGLKQMVEQLQRGASLDEAIGNVFGQVGSQFANQLKNPNQRKDDAGDAPAAVESAPQPKAPRGGGRLTPLQDERLAQYGDDLQAMAGDAGWAEEGGKLIRNDDGTMSRTRWIPRAEWFVAGMLNNPKASEEAVRKALAGEPMYRAEKLHVMGMMDFLDAQQASQEESAFIESLDSAISEDSDFGLPDYSAETAAVIELEFAQGSVDVPAFLEAIGANDEENDVTQDAAGAGQAGGAATGKPQEDGQAGQDAPGAGRAGSQSQGFGLTGQTNEQAAAEYAQQQAEQPADITKAQADKERDAVPFSLSQQSQPKPQGVQGGLFTADGRASVAAKQEDQSAAFDPESWDKARENRIKASKQSGAKHLDDVRASVESMRGKEIYYVHDHSQRGVIRTVDNRGNVYVYWSDKYSADKELASESIEDNKTWLKTSKKLPYMRTERNGNTYVFQSTLGASDLKDYVFSGSEQSANPFDEAARNAEREKFKEQLLADVRAGKVALVEGQQKLAEFDKQTKAMREGAAKPEVPKNRRDGFEQHLAEIRQRKEDRLKQAGDVSQGAILANEGGTQWQMVLPDVEGGGKWRTQSFDDRGFSGHMVFNSMHEALEDAVGQGYFKRDDEALDRLQGTPKFQRGNFAADLIRRINTGEIDMKEGDRLLAEYDAKQNGAAAVDENSDERLRKAADGDGGKTRSLEKTASWVVKNKETGEVLFETFDKAKVDALNTDKYVAVPILEYLQSLNSARDDNSPERLVERAEAVTAPEKSEASNKPEVSTHQTGVTFEQWKRAVPSLGNVNGWTLFEDKRVGDHYVLMTPYNSVRFDTEQQARDWAKENKAVAGDFNDKLRLEVRERLEAMTAQQVAATYKAMNLAGDKRGTWELGKALLQEDPQEVLDAMSGLASADDGEPNLEAAKALIQEAKETHGDKRKEAIVRKKARELAQKTPLSDEKTVLALDMVATRLGMGDGGTKALEFLPAVTNATVNAENTAKPESDSQTANLSKNQQKIDTSPDHVQESAKNAHDFSKFILISADDISKLRKIDVERVLEQGAVKQFRQEFADWIKAKRPDLAKEVDEVMADIAPAMTYDQFKAEMQRLFSLANKYKPGEIGFNEYSAKMADLSDAHPALSAKFDKEFDGPEKAALPAKTGLDKAADAIDAKIDDVAARLAAKFKASRGTLNSGVDPELLMLGAELGSLYIAKGVVKFAQYARAVLDKMKEFGIDAEEVKPMLKKFYLASQDGVDDATFDQMDDPRTVRNFDLDSLDAADSIQGKIAAAEQATNHDATPAQKEAGNYAKGKFPWNGLTISVETAKGEDRTDKETNGEKWRVTMPATYGYILRTTGADGDHVDAFMGPNPESDKVFVINQTQVGSEKFDEHKVMLGYPSERAAKADYLASFSDGFGRKVFGSIEGPFSVDEFRRMLDDGEFERKQEIDFGRRLNERTPLSDITVTVDAVEAETGRTVEMDENAADALKDVDNRMKLARSLLECLAS